MAQEAKPISNPSTADSPFNPALIKRYSLDRAFAISTWIATCFGLVILTILLVDVFTDGLPRLSWSFVTSYPSRRPALAGILSPLVGSIWLLTTVAFIAFPLGVGAGIYLEEYAADNWFNRIIEINIANLAAVPSIIYGLLGLQIFVRWMEPITNGRSILTGA
ncbi:MAG TPA: phosphate ABC transporter, permease protein PstA, partial [Coleofasciculaceae cyanobacterium]